MTTTDGSVLKELRRQHDRSAGILASAIVDDELFDAVTCLWRSDPSKKTKTVREEILRQGGALTFSLRIGIAYLSGLIGPTMHSDLVRIKDLRNKFAHRVLLDDHQKNPVSVTFRTPEIRDSCKHFLLVDNVDVYMDGRKLPTKSARHRFLATSLICSSALRLYLNNPTKKDKVIDAILKA